MKPLLINVLSAGIGMGVSGFSVAGDFEGVNYSEETNDDSVAYNPPGLSGG